MPITPAELAADAARCRAAGAQAVHVHPRAEDGRESLAAPVIADAVHAIRRAAPGLGIGVSTGAWITPDPSARLALIRSWATLAAEDRPDFASVNAHEEGAAAVARALLDGGIAVEAGLWTPAAVSAYREWAIPCLRVLVELAVADPDRPLDPDRVLDDARTILELLGAARVPILLHAEGPPTWSVLRYAVRRGLDTRIGLEDTVTLPDGSAASNASLVAAAVALGARSGTAMPGRAFLTERPGCT